MDIFSTSNNTENINSTDQVSNIEVKEPDYIYSNNFNFLKLPDVIICEILSHFTLDVLLCKLYTLNKALTKVILLPRSMTNTEFRVSMKRSYYHFENETYNNKTITHNNDEYWQQVFAMKTNNNLIKVNNLSKLTFFLSCEWFSGVYDDLSITAVRFAYLGTNICTRLTELSLYSIKFKLPTYNDTESITTAANLFSAIANLFSVFNHNNFPHLKSLSLGQLADSVPTREDLLVIQSISLLPQLTTLNLCDVILNQSAFDYLFTNGKSLQNLSLNAIVSSPTKLIFPIQLINKNNIDLQSMYVKLHHGLMHLHSLAFENYNQLHQLINIKYLSLTLPNFPRTDAFQSFSNMIIELGNFPNLLYFHCTIENRNQNDKQYIPIIQLLLNNLSTKLMGLSIDGIEFNSIGLSRISHLLQSKPNINSFRFWVHNLLPHELNQLTLVNKYMFKHTVTSVIPAYWTFKDEKCKQLFYSEAKLMANDALETDYGLRRHHLQSY